MQHLQLYANNADEAANSPREDNQVLLNNPDGSGLRLILALNCLGSAMQQKSSVGASFPRLCQRDRIYELAATQC